MHTDEPPDQVVVEAANLLLSGRALDIACGAGRHSIFLARQGWHVTALDSSDEAVGGLREVPNIEAGITDLESPWFILPPAAFDLVLDCRYLYRPLFHQIRGAVKPGGCFAGAIATVDDDPTIRSMNPAYLLHPGELLRYFGGWQVLHWSEDKHHGRRRMARLLARKPVRSG